MSRHDPKRQAAARARSHNRAAEALGRAGGAVYVLDNSLNIVEVLGERRLSGLVGAPIGQAEPPLEAMREGMEAVLHGASGPIDLPDIHWRETLPDGREHNRITSYNIDRFPSEDGLCVVAQNGARTEALRQRLLQKSNELALMHESLKGAQDRAEAASNAKRAFLANLSEDLRAPLAVIIGASEVANNLLRADANQAGELLQDISAHAARLQDAIDDLLDLASAEVDADQLSEDWCDPAAILEAAHKAAAARGQTTRIVSSGWTPSFWADAARLRKMLGAMTAACARAGAHRAVENPTVLEVGLTPQGALRYRAAPDGQNVRPGALNLNDSRLAAAARAAKLHSGVLRIENAGVVVELPSERFERSGAFTPRLKNGEEDA